jgi:ectoine hydroxylase-related dioxygenase (phytanoyl-CoA dioxygenase family)
MDPEANAHLERVPVVVPAGSVVVFGAFLAHATGPNRTDHDRRALLYSYQPAGLTHSLEGLKKLTSGRS